ncbi:hypothetical protein BJ508DRAFT_363252 [Ascobolus immersus RN42]|uniref:Uncharacterized protein n=1 Tax=Ascobolus immersus RN42 TaxID=1160509 RepID=A0A3N4I5L0_ASCIM|nr:hypothetical protein BJ508DRAFT_363252 [Ascobolus immersus RN42]
MEPPMQPKVRFPGIGRRAQLQKEKYRNHQSPPDASPTQSSASEGPPRSILKKPYTISTYQPCEIELAPPKTDAALQEGLSETRERAQREETAAASSTPSRSTRKRSQSMGPRPSGKKLRRSRRVDPHNPDIEDGYATDAIYIHSDSEDHKSRPTPVRRSGRARERTVPIEVLQQDTAKDTAKNSSPKASIHVRSNTTPAPKHVQKRVRRSTTVDEGYSTELRARSNASSTATPRAVRKAHTALVGGDSDSEVLLPKDEPKVEPMEDASDMDYTEARPPKSNTSTARWTRSKSVKVEPGLSMPTGGLKMFSVIINNSWVEKSLYIKVEDDEEEEIRTRSRTSPLTPVPFDIMCLDLSREARRWRKEEKRKIQEREERARKRRVEEEEEERKREAMKERRRATARRHYEKKKEAKRLLMELERNTNSAAVTAIGISAIASPAEEVCESITLQVPASTSSLSVSDIPPENQPVPPFNTPIEQPAIPLQERTGCSTAALPDGLSSQDGSSALQFSSTRQLIVQLAIRSEMMPSLLEDEEDNYRSMSCTLAAPSETPSTFQSVSEISESGRVEAPKQQSASPQQGLETLFTDDGSCMPDAVPSRSYCASPPSPPSNPIPPLSRCPHDIGDKVKESIHFIGDRLAEAMALPYDVPTTLSVSTAKASACLTLPPTFGPTTMWTDLEKDLKTSILNLHRRYETFLRLESNPDDASKRKSARIFIGQCLRTLRSVAQEAFNWQQRTVSSGGGSGCLRDFTTLKENIKPTEKWGLGQIETLVTMGIEKSEERGMGVGNDVCESCWDVECMREERRARRQWERREEREETRMIDLVKIKKEEAEVVMLE